MIDALLNARKGLLRVFAAVLVILIAVADHGVGVRMSLGVLYVLPMMLGGVALAPPQIVALALLCSSLRSWFDLPSPHIEVLLRFIFASISYSACGLVVAALTRIGREQALRREAEEQLQTQVESSPAAILTVDGDGTVIAANNAASRMFALSSDESLKGRAIALYLPVLADALEFASESGELKTAAQSQGRRANGEIFLANTWFSTYTVDKGKRLAAIVVDSSEEMREHEEENLRQMRRGNLIAASAVSHEVRNLSGAISVVALNLREKLGRPFDDEFQAIESLLKGLDKIASRGARSRESDLTDISLQLVLDDLRIVIESDWREIGGAVYWLVPPQTPQILAERHGLLQAFLNLAQNSHRAVQKTSVRELKISVEAEDHRVIVRFCDSGPGVDCPGHLFEPFQPGADGTGLGLYVSRAVIRGYGGDLRYEPPPGGNLYREPPPGGDLYREPPPGGDLCQEPPPGGSCFAIELQVVPPAGDTVANGEENSEW